MKKVLCAAIFGVLALAIAEFPPMPCRAAINPVYVTEVSPPPTFDASALCAYSPEQSAACPDATITAAKGNTMHYKNGRPAKNGDKVIVVNDWGTYTGILYDAQPGNDYCNGRVAITSGNDPCPNLKECLHIDDAKAHLASAPEYTAGKASDEAAS